MRAALLLCPFASALRGRAPAMAKRGLWIDTDAGFDDFLAIGALADVAELKLVTVCSGACETPQLGAERCARFLRRIGRGDVAVVAGAAARAVGDPPWLGAARANMISWCRRELGDVRADYASTPVADAVASAFGDEPPALLCLGPLTNVEAALEDGVAVASVVAMGGNRLSEAEAEFNFGCDPAAAAYVVGAAPQIVLVGKEVCDSDAGAGDVAAAGGFLGSLAAADAFAVACDPLAAYYVARPGAFTTETVAAAVDETGALGAFPGGREIGVATALGDRGAYVAWLEAAAVRYPAKAGA